VSDAALLKELLKAESSSRDLLKDAEESAAKRVHDALLNLQEDFRKQRGERLSEIAAEEENFLGGLRQQQHISMTAFEENLKTTELSSVVAFDVLKTILGLS